LKHGRVDRFEIENLLTSPIPFKTSNMDGMKHNPSSLKLSISDASCHRWKNPLKISLLSVREKQDLKVEI
jgi:hypothetical protein